ncbi:Crp/Fnr family transcriptional regulator [Reyranella sp.]|uniref:Crp/Fnr family transcriptional regulator n=1 Tax=Reyranella sp. TaxID=1929291 RepID=UPI003D106D1B
MTLYHAIRRFGDTASGVLMPHLSEAELVAGQLLRVAGQRPDITYFPVDCLLSIVSPDGIEALSVGREGSSFPELALGAAALPLDVVVSIGGRAWSIETSKLQALAAADDSIQTGLAEAYQAAFYQSALVSVGRARASRIGDLARWLYRGYEATGRASLVITHGNLANLLGTRRQTITTSLAEIEGMRLITTRRTLILIRDHAGLGSIQNKPAY